MEFNIYIYLSFLIFVIVIVNCGLKFLHCIVHPNKVVFPCYFKSARRIEIGEYIRSNSIWDKVEFEKIHLKDTIRRVDLDVVVR